MGRTKIQMQRSYYFVKKHDDFQRRLGNEYPLHTLNHGMLIKVEGATLRTMHTPGHSPGHAAFYILEDGDLISGDTVLGYGTTFFLDLHDYMQSLRTMLAVNPKRLLPGHGPCVQDACDYVSRYISHRQARADQVVDVMKLLAKPHTAIEIAAYLYDDLHKRPPIRQRQASENVSKILWLLYKENLVNAYELETLDETDVMNQSHCKYTEKDMSGFDGYASPGSLRFEDSVLWLLSINKSKI